jgi:hypothetical protein
MGEIDIKREPKEKHISSPFPILMLRSRDHPLGPVHDDGAEDPQLDTRDSVERIEE